MSGLKVWSIAMISSSLLFGGCQSLDTGDPKQQAVPSNGAIKTKPIQPSLLAGFKWQLVSATDRNNRPLLVLDQIKDQVQLSFEVQQNRQQLGFTVGCNSMGADFYLSNNTLKLGDIISTEMYCQALDKAEQLLTKLMTGHSNLSIDSKQDSSVTSPVLTQQLETGEVLQWQGTQTAEAKYQQKADIVFWEVYHQLQSCPILDQKTCLRVRPVHYDQQGLKKSAGDWDIFVESIEGYEHDSSVDTVLRLKRFTVDPVEVKGKQFVYVLDAIVESSVAQ